MPSREYRIFINGFKCSVEYTRRGHDIMIDVIKEWGMPYTTEIVDLH
tara:strand:- start:159 stop:299 length:141 start_codon:yes stop_codon:yes gene_type:complete